MKKEENWTHFCSKVSPSS